MKEKTSRSPWSWVPTLYYAQGIPYVVVMTVSVIMYKRLGISNADIALYTSWLYLPWVIKPFWSPLVDLFKTKRWWIVSMQLIVGAGLAGVAFTLPLSSFFQYSLAFLWLLAFSSATHDIAADGFYMLGLKEGQQSYFIGIRSTFYRFAMITGQGLLIILAGFFEVFTGEDPVKINVVTQPSKMVAPVSEKLEQAQNFSPQNTFTISKDTLRLSTANIPKDQADSIIEWVRDQNIESGFTLPQKQVDPKKPSWWSTYVSDPLKAWIKNLLNITDAIDTSQNEMQGNVGIVGVQYSGEFDDDQEIVLNTALESGNNSIRLVEGERLIFSQSNKNQTAFLLVQLDPKLDKSVSAGFEGRSGNIPLAWTLTFVILAGLFALFFIYHKIMLPRPEGDKPALSKGKSPLAEFGETFVSFFRKNNIGPALSFLLLFRLGEAQIVKMASPFMLDSREVGGLALTTGDVGLIYGTIGIIALTLGGILGGLLASRNGLKFWIFPMALAMNVPNLVFVYLSYTMPQSMWIISASVAFEQFGYGFGFTAYMLYMIYFAEGKHKTAHFAICTGLMALGMMLPGMISGWIQEIIGYNYFFVWVVLCTIPGFIIIRFLKIDKQFGIKTESNS